MLAMHGYHDAFSSFPAGRCGPRASGGFGGIHSENYNNARTCTWSAALWVLPFMEQSARYDLYIAGVKAGNGVSCSAFYKASCPDTATFNATAREAFAALLTTPGIAAFQCPSDPMSSQPTYNDWAAAPDYPNAVNNYVTCRGDTFLHDDPSSSCFPRGMFAAKRWYGAEACTDGTSNTAFLSERCIRKSATDKSIRGGSQDGGLAVLTNPSVCAALRNGDQHTGAILTPDGQGIFDGRGPYGSFCTVLPPNSPSCTGTSMNGIVSANSYHSGGANVAFGDGSVHFISDTIDNNGGTGNYQNYSYSYSADRTAPSYFGVWGAMGTRSGGETVTL